MEIALPRDMTTKRNRKPARPDALSSREETLRVLALGGAGGHFGHGRYPEGVFASVRYMVILRAEMRS